MNTARFVFRFDAVLQLRQNERRSAASQVADAQAALDIIDQRIADVRQRRSQLRGEWSGSLAGNVSVEGLLNRGRYDLQLDAEQRELAGQYGQIAAELARRQQRLAAANQEVRKLERLREFAEKEFESDARRREQAEMDEMATLRSARLQHLSGNSINTQEPPAR